MSHISLAGKIGLSLVGGGHLTMIYLVNRSSQRTIIEIRQRNDELRQSNLRLKTEITNLKNKYEPVCRECRELCEFSTLRTAGSRSESFHGSFNPERTFFKP